MNPASDAARISKINSNDSDPSIPARSVLTYEEDLSERPMHIANSNLTPKTRSATGPRTVRGKERSKHNALKLGVFSKKLLLKCESKREFRALLHGFYEHFQPEGLFEESLVDKLAANLWRQPRILAAEGAKIRKCGEFSEWIRKTKERAETISSTSHISYESKSGLIGNIENPYNLTRCLDLLMGLQLSIEKNGFSRKKDLKVLRELCGDFIQGFIHESLMEIYSPSQVKSEVPEVGSTLPENKSREQCKESVLNMLSFRIQQLMEIQRDLGLGEECRMEIEKVRQFVPDDPHFE
jgi:hypothetical protein